MSGLVQTTIGYGKAVFTGSVITFHNNRVKDEWTREGAQISGTRTYGTATQIHVGAPAAGNIHGTLYNDRVGFPPGTVLLLSSSRSRGGSPVADAAILLRLRPTAAVLNVGGKIPVNKDNYFGERFCMFQGPADILSIDEAEMLGLRVPRGYVDKFFNQEELADRFDVLEMTPEVTPRPEFVAVATSTGIEVKEVAATPRRRIKIRK